MQNDILRHCFDGFDGFQRLPRVRIVVVIPRSARRPFIRSHHMKNTNLE